MTNMSPKDLPTAVVLQWSTTALIRYAALNALHFGHPGVNKMCGDVMIV